MEYHRTWLARNAARGLRKTIQEAADDIDGASVRTKAFDDIGNLLVGTIEHPDPRKAENILLSYRNEFEQSLYRTYSARSYHTIVNNCFKRHFPAAFNGVCENYGEYYDHVEVDWSEDHPNQDIENITALSIAFNLRRSLITLTTQVLNFEERTGDFPGTKTQLISGWRGVCAVVGDSDAKSLAVVLLQDFIELAYVESNRGENTRSQWVRAMAALWNDGNQELIIQASQAAQEQGKLNHSFQTPSDPTEFSQKSVPHRILTSIISDGEDFTGWVAEFEETVQQRAEAR